MTRSGLAAAVLPAPRVASASVSASTMRPSASVCTTSMVVPSSAVTMSFCL
jgi:meiotically up-regulated gene 157 (Mug157) protein